MRRYFVRVPKWAQLIYPKAIWQQPPDAGTAPLWTIDDGPDPVSTPQWLDMLASRNQKAIFFLIGKKCEQYPYLVEAIRNEGHLTGGHGYVHLDGWRTKNSEYLADIQRCMTLLNTEVFRPPYGRMTLGQYRAIASKYQIMMWSLTSWDFDENVSSADISSYLKAVRNNDIIVFHDNKSAVDKVREAHSMISILD